MAPIIRRQIVSAMSKSVLSLPNRSLSRPSLLLRVARSPSSSFTYTRLLTTSTTRFQQAQAVSAPEPLLEVNSLEKFSDLENIIHPNVLTTVTKDIGLVNLTEVQQRT